MDTTTVDYAINKLTEGWQKVAPQVADVTEKYVDFVVMRATIPPIICLALVIVALIIIRLGWKKYTKLWNDDEDVIVPITVIGAVLTALPFLLFVVVVYDAILALACPEMFTIHQILNK